MPEVLPHGEYCIVYSLHFQKTCRRLGLPMPVLQDKFFTQLRASPHGFNVIADFFSRGILNVTNQQSESN